MAPTEQLGAARGSSPGVAVPGDLRIAGGPAGTPGRRPDVVALALLVLAPLAVTIPLALGGRVLLLGDNLEQNYPLRVLAGELIRHGQLPAWDPFLWSGAPLLAGWNAGAMFPLTWLFAVLGPVMAWMVGLALTYALCGAAAYLLARRLSCRPLAAFTGAVAFSYTGFMSGQMVHVGLLQGTAVLPLLLLGIDGLARGDDRLWRSAPWVGLTALSAALVVLAGDPRAASTAAIAAALYLIGCAWAARHRPARLARLAGLASAAALLGGAVSAVQWLPGLAFLHASQRGLGASTQFGSGSIPLGQLAHLLVLPFALGGNERLGLAGYRGPLNLAEVSAGVGLLALVAFFAYLPEVLAPLARRPVPNGSAVPRRRLGVWYLMALAGAVLAAGTSTPLGRILDRVPLYDGERLPGRNLAMLDLALCLLLAFLVDDLVSRRRAPLRTRSGRALGLAPLAATAGLALAARLAPGHVLGSLGLVGAAPTGDFFERQDRYLVLLIAVAALDAAFVLAAGHGIGRRLLAVATVLDLGAAAIGAAFVTVPVATVASSTPASAAIARLAGGGRYALYNPYIRSTLEPPSGLSSSGLTDLNVLRDLPSVQGYGSIVDGSYNQATATHGLETFDPAALVDGAFDALDVRVLLTFPLYLGEPIPVHSAVPVAGGPPALADGAIPGSKAPRPAPLASGPWPVPAGGSRDFRLPDERNVVRVVLVLDARSGPTPASVEIGVGDSAPLAMGSVAVVDGQAVRSFAGQTRGEVVEVRNPGRSPLVLGAVVAVTSRPDQRLLLDGALQGYLPTGHWRYEGTIGRLVVFVDARANAPAWLEAVASSAPDAGSPAVGSVRVLAGSATEPESEVVHAPRPVVLVRSVTYEPGWRATLTPLGAGAAHTVQARRFGLVQAVPLPAGSFKVTWRYAPTTLVAGAWISLAGVLVAGAVCLGGLLVAPRRQHSRRAGRRRRPEPDDPGGSPVE